MGLDLAGTPAPPTTNLRIVRGKRMMAPPVQQRARFFGAPAAVDRSAQGRDSRLRGNDGECAGM